VTFFYDLGFRKGVYAFVLCSFQGPGHRGTSSKSLNMSCNQWLWKDPLGGLQVPRGAMQRLQGLWEALPQIPTPSYSLARRVGARTTLPDDALSDPSSGRWLHVEIP